MHTQLITIARALLAQIETLFPELLITSANQRRASLIALK